MRGKKAKVLRMMAKYDVTAERPALPPGGWFHGQIILPKGHPRHNYQFLKARYAKVPLAHGLKRMHRSTRLVEHLDGRIQEEIAAGRLIPPHR